MAADQQSNCQVFSDVAATAQQGEPHEQVQCCRNALSTSSAAAGHSVWLHPSAPCVG
jgi:hypothetical protein